MEQITQLWPSLFSGLLVPLIGQIKTRTDLDIPVLWFGVQLGGAIGLAFALNWIYSVAATPEQLIQFVLANALVSGGVHAMGKTITKAKSGFRGRTFG